MAGIGFVSYLYRYICKNQKRFILVLLILTTYMCESVNLRRLYHTDLREVEFDINEARFFSQHKILTLPNKCNLTNCQTTRLLAEAVLKHCFKDECDYENYYCLHNEGSTIVPFCANFGECRADVRHVAMINAYNPAFVDIYEVPCPVGFVQPHLRHGCFALCVKDNEHLDSSSNNQSEIDNHNTTVPHSNNHEVTYARKMSSTVNGVVTVVNIPDTKDESHKDEQEITNKPVTSTHGNYENGLVVGIAVTIILLCSIFLIVICVLVKKKYKCFRSRHGKTHGNRYISNEKTVHINQNILKCENLNGATINLFGDSQTEELLESSSQASNANINDNRMSQSSCRSMNLNHNDVNMNGPQSSHQRFPSMASNQDGGLEMRDHHTEPRMDNLKSVGSPDNIENVRERGDGNSHNQTFVKHVC